MRFPVPTSRTAALLRRGVSELVIWQGRGWGKQSCRYAWAWARGGWHAPFLHGHFIYLRKLTVRPACAKRSSDLEAEEARASEAPGAGVGEGIPRRRCHAAFGRGRRIWWSGVERRGSADERGDTVVCGLWDEVLVWDFVEDGIATGLGGFRKGTQRDTVGTLVLLQIRLRTLAAR